MAGEDFVQIPPDSTGTRLRTWGRTVGGLAVEEEYVIDLPGTPTYGINAAVAMGATVTLISYTAPATVSVRLRGFIGTGNGDGYWTLLVNGAVRGFRRSNVVNPDPVIWFPNPILLPISALVEVKVRNDGLGTGEFEALLLGDGDAPS